MDIIELFKSKASAVLIEQASRQLGIDNSNQAEAAVDTAFSTLLNAISKNASTPEGVNSLNNALERDHDGSILNDLAGFLSGSAQTSNASMLNGSGILKHVLGSNEGNIYQMLSSMANIDPAKASQLLSMVAPVVMGMLGKQKQENNLNQAELSAYLNKQSVQQNRATTVNTDLITKLLDADGDGSIMDEISDFGIKTFGNLFK